MPIQSQNAVLNQYVPPFCIDRPVAGETFIYDPNKKTWANKILTASDLGGVAPEGLVWQGVFGPGDVVTISDDLTTFISTPRSEFGNVPGGARRLNDLSDVAIVLPLDKQGFVYDSTTETWGSEFTSYDNLTEVPLEFTPESHVHTISEITDASFESARIEYDALGEITGITETSDGISSFSIDDAKWINFEFTAKRPPSSITFYGYSLGANGFSYSMTVPTSGVNEVLIGGTSGSPAELLTDMIAGKIRLQLQSTDTLADVAEHAYVFFSF